MGTGSVPLPLSFPFSFPAVVVAPLPVPCSLSLVVTCHVLVADDEPHIGRIIKMKLEQGPFRVTLAYDGKQALEVLEREGDICLVLLDLMMPHLTGLDVLASMRNDRRWEKLPCIILTAAGQEQQHQQAL